MTVSNSAAVNGGILEVAQGQVTLESGGTWTVTGPATTADVTVGTFVPSSAGVPGSTGVASLTIQSGATGSNTTSVLIGVNAGANGTMTVTGDDSKWTSTGPVVVGAGGAGTLNIGGSSDIQQGAVLTSGPDSNGVAGYIGQLAGSTGTATVTGG